MAEPAPVTAPDGTVYELTGPSGAPAVVLVHGLGLTREVWKWMRPALSGRFRVLVYDLLGHGQTPPPAGPPSLRLLSAQLADLMDHCGLDRAAIVGFSLGGMIARRFAQDHPGRAAALAILHSPHRRTPGAQAAVEARVAQATAEGPASTAGAALERWFTDRFRAANPAMMETVRGWILGNDPAVYHGFYRILADGIDEIAAPIPPIRCAALVLTGDEDYGNGPEMTAAIAAEIEGSETVILPGLRHMALAEAPDSVNGPVCDFLERALGRADA